MEQRALTQIVPGITSEIRTEAGIFLPPVGQAVPTEKVENFQAVWDTGATNTAISAEVAAKLKSIPISFTQVSTGGGVVVAPVHLVNILLPGNVIVPDVAVTELTDLHSCDILIGMDIIGRGDFALTHENGETCFSFRVPGIKHINYIPETEDNNFKLKFGFSRKKHQSTARKKPKRKK